MSGAQPDTDSQAETPPAQIAVALSGGGHRATLWGLGVLVALADAHRNSQVTSVASVSGGSLANAAVGQRLDYTNASPAQVKAVVRDVARVIAGRGTVFGWWGARLYVLLVLLGPLALILGLVEAITEWPWRVEAPLAPSTWRFRCLISSIALRCRPSS